MPIVVNSQLMYLRLHTAEARKFDRRFDLNLRLNRLNQGFQKRSLKEKINAYRKYT